MRTAREIIASKLPDKLGQFWAEEILAALAAEGFSIVETGRDPVTIEAAASHLTQVAQAMWDRCETKRSPDPWETGDGEKEDAVTAWCFDKAAESVRSLSRSTGEGKAE